MDERRITLVFSAKPPYQVGSVGTGFLLGGGLILTARHVLIPENWGSPVSVKDFRIQVSVLGTARADLVSCELVWPVPAEDGVVRIDPAVPDVALLRLGEADSPTWAALPVAVDSPRLPERDDARAKVVAGGFPAFRRPDRHGTSGAEELAQYLRRETQQITGRVDIYSALVSGTAEIAEVDSGGNRVKDESLDWRGISGAALYQTNNPKGHVLVGIVTKRAERGRHDFRAVRLDRLLDASESFRRISAAGMSDQRSDDERRDPKSLEAEALKTQIQRSPWCKLLHAAPWWSRVATERVELCAALNLLALRAEQLHGRSTRVEIVPDGAGDRWQADRSLGQCLEALDLVMSVDDIDWATAALCLAVPFVYEAVLAALVLRLAESGPVPGPSPHSEALGVAGVVSHAWREAVERDADWRRRIHLLQRENREREAADIRWWQLWRFAHEAPQLWLYSAKGQSRVQGWLEDLLRENLFSSDPTGNALADELLSGDRLMRLAGLSFEGWERIEREAGKTLRRDGTVGSGRNTQELDEVRAAHLSALAFGLALDARRLPELVAEHLSLEQDFEIVTLQKQLDNARWVVREQNRVLSLKLETPYPVVHAALAAAAKEVDDYLSRLALVDATSKAGEISRYLPRVIDRAGLALVHDDGSRNLDPQHLRFTLDQRRIVRLLMGENIYSDPAIALREAYQNATDACRYRRARETFNAKRSQRESVYRGRILLEATEIGGRPAVVCQDDGIGMAEPHLRDAFARAGRRFTDGHEFRLDRAQWLAEGIQIWTNSRFGIGALSYFLLADEVRLETRRLHEDGSPARGLRIVVRGSGSLFHIVEDPAVLGGREVGTRLTLVLKDLDADPVQIIEAARDWLCLPEVETTLRIPGQPDEVLTPGELTVAAIPRTARRERRSSRLPFLPLQIGRNSLDQPRFHWAPEVWSDRARTLSFGRTSVGLDVETVLVDGIKSSLTGAVDRRVRRACRCLLVNLSEEIAADELSVSRGGVSAIPSRLLELLSQAAASDDVLSLLDWSGATLANLALLAVVWVDPIETLDKRLRSDPATEPGANPSAPVLLPLAARAVCDLAPQGVGLALIDARVAALLARSADLEIDRLSEHLMRARLAELPVNVLPPVLSSFVRFDQRASARRRLSLREQAFLTSAVDRFFELDRTMLGIDTGTRQPGRGGRQLGQRLSLRQHGLAVGCEASSLDLRQGLALARECAADGLIELDESLTKAPVAISHETAALLSHAGDGLPPYDLSVSLRKVLEPERRGLSQGALGELVDLGMVQLDEGRFLRATSQDRAAALRALDESRFVLERSFYFSDAKRPPSLELLKALHAADLSFAEAERLLSPFQKIGLLGGDIRALQQYWPEALHRGWQLLLADGARSKRSPGSWDSPAQDEPVRLSAVERADIAFAEAARLLDVLARAGLASEPQPWLSGLDRLTSSARALLIFIDEQRPGTHFQGEPVGLTFGLAAMLRLGFGWGGFEQAVDELQEAGLVRRVSAVREWTTPVDPRMERLLWPADRTGGDLLLVDVVPAWALLRLALDLQLPPAEVAEIAAPLAELGVVDADLARFAAFPFDVALLEAALRCFESPGRGKFGDLPIQARPDVAQAWRLVLQSPVDRTIITDALEALAGAGLLEIDLAEFRTRRQPSDLSRLLVSHRLDGEYADRDEALSAFELAVAVHLLEIAPSDLVPALEDLAWCGLDIADAMQFALFLTSQMNDSSLEIGAKTE